MERPRVAEALRRAMRRPIALVVAPAGFGKSFAVASIAGAVRARLPAVPGALADVALSLARALAPARNGLETALDGCMRTAGAHDAAPVFAAWLAELIPAGATVVVDDLDDALTLAGTATLIEELVGRTAPGVRWVLAARTLDVFPVARWMADELTGVPVDETVLGLQPDEVRRFLAERGFDRAALPGVEMRPATLALSCDLLVAGTARRAVASHARSLQHAAHLAFADASEDERRLIALAVHLPRLDRDVLGALGADAAASAARLTARLPSAIDSAGIATWLRASLRERVAGDSRYADAPGEARAVLARAAQHDGPSERADSAREEVERAVLALGRGDTGEADEAARRAAGLAEEHAAHDVAVQAYAVLDELARDAGEPLAELAAVERLAAAAALAGDHEVRASALVRAHALCAERGDEDGMRRAESALAFLPPGLDERAQRAVAAGRALALAWEGAFEAAHVLVAGTATAASTLGGRALRAAEIACYAAGAGLRAESHDAASAAESDLYQITESATRDRILALLALAATLAGDDAAARRRLPRAPGGEASRRTAVLLDAVAAYRRRAHGEGSVQELDDVLERARRRGFGGFARFIDALGGRPRRAAAEPADTVEGAIEQVIAELYALDPAGAVHARAVGRWCARIAQRLDLSQDDATHARRSGLLHDVGQADVPKDVLTAAKALDAEETMLVQAHAVFGERVVLANAALAPFAAAVRAHHERYDGRGYPDRLAGERIPLSARIVAVADAFDAMIARRSYRAPRTPSAALLELHRERGRQFDPDVVDAMIAVVEAHG